MPSRFIRELLSGKNVDFPASSTLLEGEIFKKFPFFYFFSGASKKMQHLISLGSDVRLLESGL